MRFRSRRVLSDCRLDLWLFRRDRREPLGERGIVKGKVTLGGKALGKGTVVLHPVDPSKGDEQTRELTRPASTPCPCFPGKYKVFFP